MPSRSVRPAGNRHSYGGYVAGADAPDGPFTCQGCGTGGKVFPGGGAGCRRRSKRQSHRPGRLPGQELPPGRRRPPRRGPEPGGGRQDPADRPLPHPVRQAEQFALDALVSPARVLPRQLLHQCPHPGRDRRSPRRPDRSISSSAPGAGARPAGCPASRSGAAASARAAAWRGRRSRRGQPSPVSGAPPDAAAPQSRDGEPRSPRCGCRKCCHPTRPGNTRGSGHRAGPGGEPGCSYETEQADADVLQAGTAAVPCAVDERCSDRRTRRGPAVGAARR
jgi:hypothetical protein